MKEVPMAGKKESPFCHKLKSNVWEHKARCKLNPEREPVKAAAHASRPRAATKRASPAPHAHLNGNGHCDACLFRGLDSAIAKELVTDAIRGGMHLEAAAGFVRRALSVRGE